MSEKKFSLEQELCFQLYVASKEVIRLYQPYLAELSLTYTGFIVIRAMEDGMSVSHLGEQLFLDSGTLSPLLKKLENKELITRSRFNKDERVLLIHLTEKGRNLQAKLPDISKKVFQEVSRRNPNIPFKDLLGNLQLFNGVFK